MRNLAPQTQSLGEPSPPGAHRYAAPEPAQRNLTRARPAGLPRPFRPPGLPRVLRGKEVGPGERGRRRLPGGVLGPASSRHAPRLPTRVAVETAGARVCVVNECRAASAWASMAWSWRPWSPPCGSWAGRAGPGRPGSHVLLRRPGRRLTCSPSPAARVRAPVPSASALGEMLRGWPERLPLREAVKTTRGVSQDLRFTSAAPGRSTSAWGPSRQLERRGPSGHLLVTFLHSVASQKTSSLRWGTWPRDIPRFPVFRIARGGLGFLTLCFDPKLPLEEKPLVPILCKEGKLLEKAVFFYVVKPQAILKMGPLPYWSSSPWSVILVRCRGSAATSTK